MHYPEWETHFFTATLRFLNHLVCTKLMHCTFSFMYFAHSGKMPCFEYSLKVQNLQCVLYRLLKRHAVVSADFYKITFTFCDKQLAYVLYCKPLGNEAQILIIFLLSRCKGDLLGATPHISTALSAVKEKTTGHITKKNNRLFRVETFILLYFACQWECSSWHWIFFFFFYILQHGEQLDIGLIFTCGSISLEFLL